MQIKQCFKSENWLSYKISQHLKHIIVEFFSYILSTFLWTPIFLYFSYTIHILLPFFFANFSISNFFSSIFRIFLPLSRALQRVYMLPHDHWSTNSELSAQFFVISNKAIRRLVVEDASHLSWHQAGWAELRLHPQRPRPPAPDCRTPSFYAGPGTPGEENPFTLASFRCDITSQPVHINWASFRLDTTSQPVHISFIQTWHHFTTRLHQLHSDVTPLHNPFTSAGLHSDGTPLQTLRLDLLQLFTFGQK